ncbi:hypothetical protein GDO81_011146 [Engystomops pustulosus]|uniref:Uncharacterized protein n=1 Tax=Engystomops pustulosus TaxID=76066 RepID=A0AAV7BCV6_ENGPU|nr:hypothetical protein GDO81_011146 [Engystomops pustulosus]
MNGESFKKKSRLFSMTSGRNEWNFSFIVKLPYKYILVHHPLPAQEQRSIWGPVILHVEYAQLPVICSAATLYVMYISL